MKTLMNWLSTHCQKAQSQYQKGRHQCLPSVEQVHKRQPLTHHHCLVLLQKSETPELQQLEQTTRPYRENLRQQKPHQDEQA